MELSDESLDDIAGGGSCLCLKKDYF